MVEASIDTNIDRVCISNCCNGRQKTAGGMTWEFYNERMPTWTPFGPDNQYSLFHDQLNNSIAIAA
jgi:hypothetical protein